MAGSPLLSVIVPSRNRARYARYCIDNILSVPSPDLECVVLDNSDGDELAQYAATLRDPRLRYRHVSQRLSFAKVFEEAYALSTGRFVTFIGDDDGVLPDIIAVAQWMADRGVDSLTTPLIASYGWPDFHVKLGLGFHRGEAILRHFSGAVTVLDVEAELHRCAAASFQKFDYLTKVYYGIVSRVATERARSVAGALFWGSSPDISGCLAVASYVSKHVFFDFPLFVSGASGGSAAGRAGRNEHYGSLRNEAQTAEFADAWPSQVPSFFAEETVWAHTALLTLEKHHRQDVIAGFNSVRLHGKSLALSPWKYKRAIASSFQGHVLKSSANKVADTYRCAMAAGGYATRKWLTYGYRASRAGYFWKYRRWFKGVENVAGAAVAIAESLRAEGQGARVPLERSAV